MSVWQDNSPDTLVDICARYCVEHLETFCDKSGSGKFLLRNGISIPNEICEKMLEVFQTENTLHYLDDNFVNIFRDTERTRLKRVNVHRSQITDIGLSVLMKHNIIELDISDCVLLGSCSLLAINNNGGSLLSLNIGNSTEILPMSLFSDGFDSSMDIKDFGVIFSKYHQNGYLLKTPNLRKLAIRNFKAPDEQVYYPLLLKPLTRLSHLDLSGCHHLGSLSCILSLKNLVSLVLYNVFGLQEVLPNICYLKALRQLDISQSKEENGMYSNPNKTLDTLVQSLPELESLDISGTNLAGTGIAETEFVTDSSNCPQSDIPGLKSRVKRPLKFLGLYQTANDACLRHHIPAIKITGDGSEEQILAAAEAYCSRPEILQTVLNDLFQIFRYEVCKNTKKALDVIIHGMNSHIHEKHIQIAGSASLFYIVKGEELENFNVKVKNSIVRTLLNGMSEHRSDITMMRNGCLTLCHFKIPRDVLFDYERLVQILLYVVHEKDQEEFVQRLGIYLLNSLACQVEGRQKLLVGDYGAISTMLHLIDDRLSKCLCDEVMEIAWSTMWNVTDETAQNCQRFLDCDGMNYFIKCLRMFPSNDDLLRNMMGLLGNVAEVDFLRPRLMTPSFVQVFVDLLNSKSDGIEVSYNAAGVLSHMISDGEEAWNITSPSREEVLRRIVESIDRWELDKQRNINYRSFDPILRLVRADHAPEAQYWAIWALANLTTVYPTKYCSLVIQESGVVFLQEVLSKPVKYPNIHTLAKLVLKNCEADIGQNCVLE